MCIRDSRGICGQVDGSVVPGMLGMEAGQSAFGDVYAWFKNVLMWPAENIIKNSKKLNKKAKEEALQELESNLIAELSKQAAKLPIGESGITALDWLNGRRTPDANQLLKGAIMGLNLGSDAPRIFRALVEATAFGSKLIFDRFVEEGVKIGSVIAIGGVAKKSPFVMQCLADVLNVPIKVVKSDQACALGTAMAAAVVAGIYPNVETAEKHMGSGFEKEYKPNAKNAEEYKALFTKYQKLGAFIESQTR